MFGKIISFVKRVAIMAFLVIAFIVLFIPMVIVDMLEDEPEA